MYLFYASNQLNGNVNNSGKTYFAIEMLNEFVQGIAKSLHYNAVANDDHLLINSVLISRMPSLPLLNKVLILLKIGIARNYFVILRLAHIALIILHIIEVALEFPLLVLQLALGLHQREAKGPPQLFPNGVPRLFVDHAAPLNLPPYLLLKVILNKT